MVAFSDSYGTLTPIKSAPSPIAETSPLLLTVSVEVAPPKKYDRFIAYLGVVANTTNALLGVSIFSMPWAYHESGVIGGVIVQAFTALLSFETARMLLTTQRSLYQSTGEVYGFPDIAAHILGGNFWSFLIQTATAISCIGGCTGYLIFLGEVVDQLLGIALWQAVAGLALPLVLLSWIRSFRELTFFTILGVLAVFGAIVAIFADGAAVLHSEGHVPGEVALLRPMQTLGFLGPATFLYTIHYCILSMGSETLCSHALPSIACSDEEPPADTSGNLQGPISVAYWLSSALIVLLGVVGSVLYGTVDTVRDAHGGVEPGCENHVCQNVILNLSAGRIRDVVGFALIAAIVLSYIVILIPAREHIERYVMRFCSHLDTERNSYCTSAVHMHSCGSSTLLRISARNCWRTD